MSTRMRQYNAGLRAIAVASMALAVLTALLAVPAAASQAPEVAGGEVAPVRVTGEQFRAPGNTRFPAAAFWPSQERAEAYVLHHSTGDRVAPYDRISRVGLPGGEAIVTTQLGDGKIGGYRAKAMGNQTGIGITSGSGHTVALDEAGGRIFVAYQQHPNTGQVVDASRGAACVSNSNLSRNCVRGVLVLDALSLEPIARVDLRNVGVDASPLQGELLAMAYAPPRVTGDAGKLLMLLVTSTHVTIGPEEFYVQPDSMHLQPQHLVQLDPDNARTDWVMRLDACRGNRTAPSNSYTEAKQVRALPHHSALFRSSSLEQPAVVVGCRAGSAWTGTVVQSRLAPTARPPRCQ